MENGHESLSNGKPVDPGLQIIRHPSYQSCGKLSLSWLDIRVFYIRVSNFMVDDSTPEYLTLNHIPLSPDTLLEVNGTRCSMYSEGASCLLRRDRVDKKSEEATFVSTDSIRLTGSVKFEVFNKDDLVLSGILEMSNCNGFVGESKNSGRRWNMNCEAEMNAGTGFLKGKQIIDSESLSPIIEVFITGCFSGTPIILTKSLQLNHRKKHNRKGMLHSIPEHETDEQQKDVPSGLDLQPVEISIYSRFWHYQSTSKRLRKISHSSLSPQDVGLHDLAPAFPSRVCRSYYLPRTSFPHIIMREAEACLLKNYPPQTGYVRRASAFPEESPRPGVLTLPTLIMLNDMPSLYNSPDVHFPS